MNEMEALYPYLCKNSSYFDNQTENHQEIIHELDWYGCNWSNEVSETMLKSVLTKIIGQGGKIRKLRRSCNRFWMHYEHKVKSCTICTDAFIEKWENIVDIKFENAVSQKSKLNTFCCMLKFDRNFISLWGRKQTSDMDHNKKMNKLKLSQAKLSHRGGLNQNWCWYLKCKL